MQRVPYLSIVVSPGRSGSRFLGQNLGQWIRDCRSWHEPDVVDLHHPDLLQKCQLFGWRYMTLDRLAGRSGVRALSEQWLGGRITRDEAIERLRRARIRLFGTEGDWLRVESYSGWWGCLDLLGDIAHSVRVVAVTRHPCTWVESCLSWGALHGPRDLLALVGNRSAHGAFSRTARIDALAATYNRLQASILDAETDPEIALKRFRYEDIFTDAHALGELVDWVRTHDDQRFGLRSTPDPTDPVNRSPRRRGESSRLGPGEADRVWSQCREIGRLLGYHATGPSATAD